MRAFIALELSPQLREGLDSLMRDLKGPRGIKGRWVPWENIHLTLRFLGEVDEEQVEAIGELLERVAAASRPFSLSLEGLGAFPSSFRPRVLWVGVKKGLEVLEKMYNQLEEGLFKLGVPPNDKAFKPHLTLARFKNPDLEVRRRVHAACKDMENRPFGEMEVKAIVLYESILSPQGARYRKVKEAFLGAPSGPDTQKGQARGDRDQ